MLSGQCLSHICQNIQRWTNRPSNRYQFLYAFCFQCYLGSKLWYNRVETGHIVEANCDYDVVYCYKKVGLTKVNSSGKGRLSSYSCGSLAMCAQIGCTRGPGDVVECCCGSELCNIANPTVLLLPVVVFGFAAF
ncbi:unnamed protein product [Caenorhabditis auriculariae]|uniref:Uncharacterized protein n=1 Tax=Caenorhabditis auriculariae TaxID=2777116 RepID=A0A8S1HML4_9PELO|nr:unnamed protein product [Caenorhabditis auriculariae]